MMDLDWKALLRTVAPSIATALGSPLAGMAVAAIGNALNITEPTQEKIQQALAGATPDDMLKLKQADQQFAKDMKMLDVDLERIAGADRDSARRMQTETKSNTPAILSFLIVGLYITVQVFILTSVINDDMREIVMRSLGTLDASLGLVLAFWLGSTSANRTKDATIQAISTRKS